MGGEGAQRACVSRRVGETHDLELVHDVRHRDCDFVRNHHRRHTRARLREVLGKIERQVLDVLLQVVRGAGSVNHHRRQEMRSAETGAMLGLVVEVQRTEVAVERRVHTERAAGARSVGPVVAALASTQPSLVVVIRLLRSTATSIAGAVGYGVTARARQRVGLISVRQLVGLRFGRLVARARQLAGLRLVGAHRLVGGRCFVGVRLGHCRGVARDSFGGGDGHRRRVSRTVRLRKLVRGGEGDAVAALVGAVGAHGAVRSSPFVAAMADAAAVAFVPFGVVDVLDAGAGAVVLDGALTPALRIRVAARHTHVALGAVIRPGAEVAVGWRPAFDAVAGAVRGLLGPVAGDIGRTAVAVSHNVTVAPAHRVRSLIADAAARTVAARVVVLFRAGGAVRAEPVVATATVASVDADADQARHRRSVIVAVVPLGAVAGAVRQARVVRRASVARRVGIVFGRAVLALVAEPEVVAVAVAAMEDVSRDALGVSRAVGDVRALQMAVGEKLVTIGAVVAVLIGIELRRTDVAAVPIPFVVAFACALSSIEESGGGPRDTLGVASAIFCDVAAAGASRVARQVFAALVAQGTSIGIWTNRAVVAGEVGFAHAMATVNDVAGGADRVIATRTIFGDGALLVAFGVVFKPRDAGCTAIGFVEEWWATFTNTAIMGVAGDLLCNIHAVRCVALCIAVWINCKAVDTFAAV